MEKEYALKVIDQLSKDDKLVLLAVLQWVKVQADRKELLELLLNGPGDEWIETIKNRI